MHLRSLLLSKKIFNPESQEYNNLLGTKKMMLETFAYSLHLSSRILCGVDPIGSCHLKSSAAHGVQPHMMPSNSWKTLNSIPWLNSLLNINLGVNNLFNLYNLLQSDGKFFINKHDSKFSFMGEDPCYLRKIWLRTCLKLYACHGMRVVHLLLCSTHKY